jgi:probable phosphoglycerate mutase
VIARWDELPVSAGARFAMPAGSLAVCGFEHALRQLGALGLTAYPQPAAAYQ